MSNLNGKRVGVAMTGSFCTFRQTFEAWRKLAEAGAELIPILSETAYACDTRFYTAAEVRTILREICGREPLHTIPEVEPIGPKKLLDLLIVAPCTGNTLAKLACGIADTAPTLAVKSHLRNERPVLIAVSSNDALSRNGASLGKLLPLRNFYFVPFGQDAPEGKPASLVAHMETLILSAEAALEGRQIQPVLT